MMAIVYDVVSFVTVFCLIFLQQSDAFQPCQRSKPLPNSTVHFVNPHDLVPEVHGCFAVALKFQCCMTSYSSVRWFQFKDGEWRDFLDFSHRRYAEDDNQTAILTYAWNQSIDGGTYKCIGCGLTPGDEISHSLNVTLKECPDIGTGPPIPFIPESAKTEFKFSLSEIASIICGAIFGMECSKESGGTYCTMNWTRTGNRQDPIPECSNNSIVGICYENSPPGSSVNDQTTVLHIDGVTQSDFGTYVCSMQNKHGTTERTIIISKKGKIVSHILQSVMIGVLCCAFVFVLIGTVVYWHKWELRIRWNVLKQNFLGNTNYRQRKNILLLHTSSTKIDESFARYCSNKLKKLCYNVFIENDIDGGRDVISELHDKAKLCSSIIVLLSPDFLTDEDQRGRLPLRSIIRSEANIIFLLLNVSIQHHVGFFWTSHAIIDRSNDSPILTKLSEDLTVAIKLKKKFEYPIPVDPNKFLDTIWESLEVLHQNEVRTFWEKLIWSLPQQEESDPLL